MKEIKYIVHAFLLLLAFTTVFICLKAIYSLKKPETAIVMADRNQPGPEISSRGRQLFQSKCTTCHALFRHLTGPGLCNFESRGPWSERENVYQWLRNPIEFMKKDRYTRELKDGFGGAMMQAFPDLTNADIDEIISYINGACNPTIAKN
jgi:cytochrome c2